MVANSVGVDFKVWQLHCSTQFVKIKINVYHTAVYMHQYNHFLGIQIYNCVANQIYSRDISFTFRIQLVCNLPKHSALGTK